MKVIILKGDNPRHNYFAAELLKIKGVDFKVISPNRLSNNRLKKMLLKSPKTFFNRMTKYLVYWYLKWVKQEKEFFGDNVIECEDRVEGINSEATVRKVKDFNPDLIVAFGVPIVSNKIIDVPRFKAINLHGGISPQYKGGNTIFWPLLEGKPEMAGATLHYMVKKVDSGKIIAKVYPDIKDNDDEVSVSCKTFKYATAEMVRIVEWIRDHDVPIEGEEQQGLSRLYLAKHRTLKKDVIALRKIKKNLKGVDLAYRIERFY